MRFILDWIRNLVLLGVIFIIVSIVFQNQMNYNFIELYGTILGPMGFIVIIVAAMPRRRRRR